MSALPEFGPNRFSPFPGLGLSCVVHSAIFALLLTISVPSVPEKQVPPPQARFTEIVIDKKVYYITPLSTEPAPRELTRKNVTEVSRSPVEPQTAPKVTAEARAPEPRSPKVSAPFIPPDIRKEPVRRDVLIQADLLTPTVTPDAQQLPSFQAWTGRLAPYRREFVVPGQRKAVPTKTVDLDAQLPPVPVIASAATSAVQPKLRLAPPPPAIQQDDLPALEIPNAALAEGNPINVVSSTVRLSVPDRLLIPPDSKMPAEGQGDTGTEPERQAAAQGKSSGSPPAAATGSSPVAGREVAAVRTAPPSEAKPREAAVQPESNAGFITRSPQGRFDSVVIQSSPLDQFPSGSTLLRGRPIYTVYVSVGTAKDWAMYFSVPTDSSSSQASPVDPPYPYKLLRPKVTVPSYQKYVLVHGFVTETGGLRDLQAVQPVPKATADLVIAALNQWTFRPAARQGAPISVEFVIAIPAGTY